MPGLDLDAILLDEEYEKSPFNNDIAEDVKNPHEENIPKDEDIDPAKLFDSIDSNRVIDTDDEDNEGDENIKLPNTNNNSFGIFGAALVEEGVLTTVTEEDISKINSGEDLVKLIEKEVESRFDERNKRINDALNAGVEAPIIKQYEGVINYLDNLTESAITAESEEGEALRAQLIMEDYLTKGFSKERAERETKKSIDSGNDIEDAKEALAEVKKHYKSLYNSTIKEKEAEANKAKEKEIESAKKVENLILKEKDLFPGLDLSKDIRQRIADVAYKPIHTDASGNRYSAIQKYQKENPEDFLAKVSTIFTLTDGFKDLSKLINSKVAQTTSKKIKDLGAHLANVGGNEVSLRNASGENIQTRTGKFIIDN